MLTVGSVNFPNVSSPCPKSEWRCAYRHRLWVRRNVMIMHLRQLEYFVAVSELESFTKAAEHLFVAQPSLSQQIRRLEASLKVTLLDRTPHGARLTAAGRVLLPAAREILAATARAEQAVRDVRTGQWGELQVLAPRSVATGILPPSVTQWHEAYPNVVLKIRDFPHVEAMEAAFRAGEGDIAVGPRMDYARAELSTLGFEEYVLIAGPATGFLAGTPVGLTDLRNEDWVLFTPEHGLTRIIRALCDAVGYEPVAKVWTGQVEAALEIASSGAGVTLVPDNVVRGEARSFSRSLSPRIYREIFAHTRPDANLFADAYADILCRSRLPLVAREDLPALHCVA